MASSSSNSYEFIALIDLYGRNVTARVIKPYLSYFCAASEITVNAQALNILASRIAKAVKNKKFKGDVLLVKIKPEHGSIILRQERGAIIFRHSMGGPARDLIPASSFHRIWRISPNP